LHSVYSLPPTHPCYTLFPYTTLFRSPLSPFRRTAAVPPVLPMVNTTGHPSGTQLWSTYPELHRIWNSILHPVSLVHNVLSKTEADRKSTRLNSSHVSISYAVFCLKKN